MTAVDTERALLRWPVRHAARQLALQLSQHVGEACDRLADPDDSEALHDFRVALRRLRTFLRAYEPQLPVRKRMRKRLQQLARSTNELRDVEVGLAWMRSQRKPLTRRQRLGCDWLVERLAAREREIYAQLRKQIPPRWRRAEQRLLKRLGSPFADQLGVDSFAQATGPLLRAHAEELEQQLAAVHGLDDEAPAHAARIRAKRLRYLLEPLRAGRPQARELVKQLKQLQDLFGDLNDAHVMRSRLREAAGRAGAERAARLFDMQLALEPDLSAVRRARPRAELSGLVALARRADQQAEQLFAQVGEAYLDGRVKPLTDRVRQLADALDGGPPVPDEATEAAADS